MPSTSRALGLNRSIQSDRCGALHPARWLFGVMREDAAHRDLRLFHGRDIPGPADALWNEFADEYAHPVAEFEYQPRRTGRESDATGSEWLDFRATAHDRRHGTAALHGNLRHLINREFECARHGRRLQSRRCRFLGHRTRALSVRRRAQDGRGGGRKRHGCGGWDLRHDQHHGGADPAVPDDDGPPVLLRHSR